MQTSRLKVHGRAFAHIAAFHRDHRAAARAACAPSWALRSITRQARVKQALQLCGVDEIHTGIGETGVVGVIGAAARPAAA